MFVIREKLYAHPVFAFQNRFAVEEYVFTTDKW